MLHRRSQIKKKEKSEGFSRSFLLASDDFTRDKLFKAHKISWKIFFSLARKKFKIYSFHAMKIFLFVFICLDTLRKAARARRRHLYIRAWHADHFFFLSQKVRHRFLRMFCIFNIANKRYGVVYTAVALQFNTIDVARRVDAGIRGITERLLSEPRLSLLLISR